MTWVSTGRVLRNEGACGGANTEIGKATCVNIMWILDGISKGLFLCFPNITLVEYNFSFSNVTSINITC